MDRSAAKRTETETIAAWRQYLKTCRRAASYESVEPYAWARLQERLRAIADHKE
jgi:hypothetical protein